MSTYSEPQIPEFGTPEFEAWWESQYYPPIESRNMVTPQTLSELERAAYHGFVGK